jgi:hypothetical protein
MINGDGTLGAWKLGPPMPAIEDEVGAAAWGSSVFVNDDFGGAAAVMLPDGGMSGWVTTTTVNRSTARLVAIDARLYLATGSNGSGIDLPEVYVAQILAPQTLSGWTATTPLPADGGARNDSTLVASGRTLYVVGGDINDIDSASVLMATVDNAGAEGPWTEVTPLPSGGDHVRALAVQNHVTLLGGSFDVGSARSVFAAPILDGGSLGSWQAGGLHPNLDTPLHAAHAGFAYLLSGSISSGVDTTSTIYAPVSAAGIATAWQTTSAMNVARHSGTAVVVEVPP